MIPGIATVSTASKTQTMEQLNRMLRPEADFDLDLNFNWTEGSQNAPEVEQYEMKVA